MNGTQQDFPWVDLESSLQWRAFQRAVEILQRRNNRVYVLVGPFNEHMLTDTSKERYRTQVKEVIADWLRTKQVPHVVPVPLATELYGDASHPLAKGYKRLAQQLLDDPLFQSKVKATASGNGE